MASPGKPAGRPTYTSIDSYPSNLTNVNRTLYFWADDSINGYEPWRIDSTGNAVLIKDINPGLEPSYPSSFTNVDGKTYFTASDATNGRELWTINSTGNAELVKDINSNAIDSSPAEFTNVNGTLYFTAYDDTNQRDLWKVDSTGNAELVKDINPSTVPSYASYASNLTNVDGTLYFTANDFANENPYEQKLWKTDNSGATVLVKNLTSATDLSFSSSFTNVNGILYFVTSRFTPTGLDDNPITPNNRQELWKVDSTGNVVLVKSNPGPDSFSLSNLTNVNGTLYFTDIDATNGEELWRIDSTGNAVLVKNIRSGPYSSYEYYQSNLTNINGTLYFTAIDPINGEGLWKVDSNSNAMFVKDINADNNSSSSYLSNLTSVNGNLYFIVSIIGDATNRQELWRIDSTENAVLVKDIGSRFDPYYNRSSAITNVNGTLYFTANDATNGQELWRIDSAGNAVLVKDINPGTDSSQPSDLTNANGTLYFTAYDTITGRELWKIDPEGNAVLVKDINPGTTSSDPIYSRFVAYGGGEPSGKGGESPSPLTPDKTTVVDLFNRNLLETTNEIKGLSIQAVSQKNNNKVNEIGFFNVDDRSSKIDGIAPGEAGYIKAAIDRAKSILTTLGGDFFNTDKQEIGLDPNKIYQFFEIENGSLTEAKQQLNKGEIPTNIVLSNLDPNGYNPIKITRNSIQSSYDISINSDELVLKVTKLNGIAPNIPIGSESQGKSEGRIIDLTKYKDRSLTVDITTKSDAVYQSQIGFYVVKDAIGTIELADGTTVKPGDANYAMVAIKNAIVNGGLQANRIDSKTNQPIAGGQIYAPVVVAQGTMNDFVNKTSNNVQAYFNYTGANTDKVDHFRQIGANTFGVEDMYGGGDRDFNDIVIQMKIKTA
jgi:trimeric autotransporter adhesin